MSSLSVTVSSKAPKTITVHPVGSIDTITYEILEKDVDTVLQGAPDVLVFDMEDVEYISSAVVRVILKAKKMMKQLGGVMLLVHLQPQIRKVFDILHALPTMKVFASIEELDQYLDQMQRNV